jgi:hypothetical protein
MSLYPAGKKENSTLKAVKESVPGFNEPSAFEKCCPKLTFKQRLIGFCSCAGFGYLLSLIGTLTLIGGATPENLRTFAILYVMGNIIALVATGFLLGPAAQCTKMWAETRRYSTAFYLIMLIVVFSVALTKQHIALIFFCLFIQILAGAWYALSYVPFGRKIVIGGCKRTVCKPCVEAMGEGGDGGGGGGGSSG